VKGRAALADALEREEWARQRDRPPFLTWLALSWQARPGIFLNQLRRRRKFLLKEIAREKKTLLSIYDEVGHKYHEAVWMVDSMIQQMRTEVRWTHRLERELARGRRRSIRSSRKDCQVKLRDSKESGIRQRRRETAVLDLGGAKSAALN